MTGWKLPKTAVIGGKRYDLHTDYREILEMFAFLQDAEKPEFIRWHIALALFFEQPLPEESFAEGAAYFRWFVNCGREEERDPGPQLLNWEQDAQDIVSDVNKVAGREIRSLPYLHWWTFMGWFYSIGEGNLSMVVSIRDKLRCGKKLEPHEQTFYRRNKTRIDGYKKYSASELAEQERLQKLLG